MWQRRVRAALAPHGLTHVQFVLLATAWWLEDHERAPTQARLAAQAATDPMMTSQVLRRLEAQQFVERNPDPADSRARRVSVTAAGRAVLAGALADVEAADAEIFGPLGDDRAAVVAGLATLAKAGP